MINRLVIAISLKFDSCPFLFHKNRLTNGERTNRIDGIPIYRCNLSGNGKIPAPAIDTEKDRIMNAGIVLISISLQTLYNPSTKATLNAEHVTNPVVNTYCDFVPTVPNSLTILIK